MTSDGQSPKRQPDLIGEVSGSLADFGTFLPLVLGVVALGAVDATGVLTGFGFSRSPLPCSTAVPCRCSR